MSDEMYSFKLLSETSGSVDLFDDKTHEKIANTLYEIIKKESSEGVTIGLEGGWGSGKSTVVSILKQKLKSDPNVVFFYFDAWAHEGDPLRRVFLEALIDQVGDNNLCLNDIKERVSNRKRVSKIESKQTITSLGKRFALSAIFVPLGAAIISDTASHIGLQNLYGINWVFIAGLLLVLAPGWVALYYYFILNQKDISKWMFIQGESESTVTQEISEDEERSSIEFEKYFCKIINAIFQKNTECKLLIVVDNLDRVDAKDSLKIWSTLQTFLQRRSNDGNSNLQYSKIWTLVPYDEEGLANLWRQQSNGDQSPGKECASINNEKSEINVCAKSFFDKCFQLRVEVPKLILSGWESFSVENINIALTGWGQNDKDVILNVLKWTRDGVNDIPTPREIKTYINQVGLLRLHCDITISTTAIAYYAVQKYMRFQTNKEIERKIISNQLPLPSDKKLFDKGLSSEISGILFGVSTEKGQQLLLEPMIEKTLTLKDRDQLIMFCKTHNSAFWTVFDLHHNRINDFSILMKYSSSVRISFLDTDFKNCIHFIDHLKKASDELETLVFPTQEDVDEYVSTFYVLEKGNYDFTGIWKLLVTSLSVLIKAKEFNFIQGNRNLVALAGCLKQKPTQYALSGISIDNWSSWAKACASEKLSSFIYVKPVNGIFQEISALFTPGVAFPETMYDLVTYLVKAKETGWEKVITAIQSYVDWNQGNPSGTVFTIEIFKILAILTDSGTKAQKTIERILRAGSIYNLSYNLSSEGSERFLAYIIGVCLPNELESIAVPSAANSTTGLQQVRNFWKVENPEYSKFILSSSVVSQDFQYIWKLLLDLSNKLISSIIKEAVDAQNEQFFSFANTLERMKNAMTITGDDPEFSRRLARYFIKNGQIEKVIIDSKSINAELYSRELNIVAELSDNIELLKVLTLCLHDITKEQWEKSLADNSHLTSLLVTIKNKKAKIKLEDNLYEPLLGFLKQWISNAVSPDEVQIQELPEIIGVLKVSFSTQIKSRLATFLVEKHFNGNPYAVSNLINYIDVKSIISDHQKIIEECLEDSLRKAEKDRIEIIDLILSHKDCSTFTPSSQLKDIFRAPIEVLLESSDEKETIIINRIINVFKVDFNKSEIENKDEGDKSDSNPRT